nr:hypothetical protein [uncultured Rhodopila sp.]
MKTLKTAIYLPLILIALAAAYLSLAGCQATGGTATTQPSTQPTLQSTLAGLQADWAALQPFVAIAEAIDPSVKTYADLVTSALAIANGNPTAQNISTAASAISSLSSHPAVVSAKATGGK